MITADKDKSRELLGSQKAIGYIKSNVGKDECCPNNNVSQTIKQYLKKILLDPDNLTAL